MRKERPFMPRIVFTHMAMANSIALELIQKGSMQIYASIQINIYLVR